MATEQEPTWRLEWETTFLALPGRPQTEPRWVWRPGAGWVNEVAFSQPPLEASPGYENCQGYCFWQGMAGLTEEPSEASPTSWQMACVLGSALGSALGLVLGSLLRPQLSFSPLSLSLVDRFPPGRPDWPQAEPFLWSQTQHSVTSAGKWAWLWGAFPLRSGCEHWQT